MEPSERGALRQFDHALAECFSHLRDVSVRDGIQSWDANKMPIDGVLRILKPMNTLAELVEEYGGIMAPAETGGGGQVAQPALFLAEDPLINLEDIHKVAPNLILQALFRGRQGFGFIPVCEEVQRAALEAAVERGVEVIRIFDMMNDISNVEPGIRIMKEIKNAGKKVTIEGAISYINAAKDGKCAWSLDDYGHYAVDLARLGCDEIAIKDYAGVGNKTGILPLIDAIRHKLDRAGFKGMKINLHTHGQKPELLLDAMKKGVDKVDVAFGELSGGPSHTNIMDVLKLMLKEKGFDVDGEWKQVFDNHPIIEQIGKIEAVITEELDKPRKDTKDNLTLRERRLAPRSQQQIESYHMAGGAMSDMWGRLPLKDFDSYKKMWEQKRGVNKLSSGPLDGIDSFMPALDHVPATKDEWFTMALETGAELWEKGGCFNTVTPGAKIITDQVLTRNGNNTSLLDKRITGEPILMTDYTDAYLDAVLGRYGKNKGLDDDSVGDKRFRTAARMFRGLKKINSLAQAKDITPEQVRALTAAALGFQENAVRQFIKGGMINLDERTLERRLGRADVEAFSQRVRDILGDDAAKAVTNEMRIGKSPEPKEGLDAGFRRLEELRDAGIDVKTMHEAGKRISYGNGGKDAALLVMMLNEGSGSRDIAGKMLRAIDQDKMPWQLGATSNGRTSAAPAPPAHARS